MPLDREKTRAVLFDYDVRGGVEQTIDALEACVTPQLAEVDARIVSEAEAKLSRIRQLIRDDHLIEWMGTEYLPLNEVRAILDGQA